MSYNKKHTCVNLVIQINQRKKVQKKKKKKTKSNNDKTNDKTNYLNHNDKGFKFTMILIRNRHIHLYRNLSKFNYCFQMKHTVTMILFLK